MQADRAMIIANLLVILALAAMLSASMAGEGSVVALARDSSQLANAGNVELMVSGDGMTGMALLGVNESISIGKEENVKAEQA